MKKLSLLAALAASVLTLSACSDGGTAPAGADVNNTNDSNTAEDAAPELPGIGEKAEGDGVAMTVDYVTLTADLEEVTDTSGFLEDKATVARDGATFALVGATVENTGNSSLSPSCGGDVRTNLYVDERSYESQSDQQFSLNYEGSCTVDLGPGLTETAIYAFEIPEEAEPTEFGFFRNDGGERGQETRISLDGYQDKGDGPNPTLASSSPTETTTTQTTAAVTTTTTTQQPAASSPAYGASCSAGQAGMPATGPDGSNLVCTGMGASGFSWVYGPAPRGAGTAELGGSCTEGEQGGQDAQGRLLLCSNGQWYSGP